MGEANPRFVEVVVGARDLRGAQTFHYSIPESLRGHVQPGRLVLVPFGARQTFAFVLRLTDSTPVPETREVMDVIAGPRLVDPLYLELARWLAEHYAAPFLDAIQLVAPPGLARYLRSAYTPVAGGDESHVDLTARERGVLRRVRELGEVSQADLQRELDRTAALRGAERLVRAGLLNRKLALRLPSPRTERVALAVEPDSRECLRVRLARAPKQRALWERLACASDGVAVREVLAAAGASEAVLRALVERGFARIERHWKQPFLVTAPSQAECDGARVDEDAWSALQAALDSQSPGAVLLQGDDHARYALYARAVNSVVAAQRRALVVAPDVRTAAELAARLAANTAAVVAEAARARTDAERVALWQAVGAGEIDVLVGTRAAAFSPFAALGVVIVDREEDPAHKNRVAPRFNARTCAEEIARGHRCAIVLGAETPSVESFFAAQTERYRLVTARSPEPPRQTGLEAGDGRSVPRPAGQVDVVDLRSAPTAGRHGVIARPLLEALRETLHADGRAVLYVNRRGAASLTVCRDCGYVFECARCSRGLVQHQHARALICHLCNWRCDIPTGCPTCHGVRLRLWGYGSESVADAVARLLPTARVARIDSDCPAAEMDAAVEAFARRDGVDVIVGTQRLLNYGSRLRASLLGIVQADIGLHFPDFLAPERVYLTLMRLHSLVTGSRGGASTVVQTHVPDHHVVEALRTGSYAHFFEAEIAERESGSFPPFRPLALVSVGHRSDESAEAEARRARRELDTVLAASGSMDVEVLGPAPAVIRRRRGQYRWQMLLLGRDMTKLLPLFHRGWTVDVDPISLS